MRLHCWIICPSEGMQWPYSSMGQCNDGCTIENMHQIHVHHCLRETLSRSVKEEKWWEVLTCPWIMTMACPILPLPRIILLFYLATDYEKHLGYEWPTIGFGRAQGQLSCQWGISHIKVPKVPPACTMGLISREILDVSCSNLTLNYILLLGLSCILSSF